MRVPKYSSPDNEDLTFTSQRLIPRHVTICSPISLKEPAMKVPHPSVARFFAMLLMLTTSVWCVAQTYSITDLGTLGGSSSGAKAINASAQVTGYSSASGNAVTDVFRYSAGHMS